MSVILTNGFRLPETGDFGSSFFPDLEFNIQRVNDHTHNGTDSNRLDASSITAQTSIISSSDFSVVGTEQRATVNLPSNMLVDSTNISFRDITTKEPVYLKYERFSASQIYVFTNFPDNYEALFTT